MTRETTEKCLAKRTAHNMRAAAIRLARERAAEEADPSLTYGCVDWFRYDATSPPHVPDTEQQPAAGQPRPGQAASRRVFDGVASDPSDQL